MRTELIVAALAIAALMLTSSPSHAQSPLLSSRAVACRHDQGETAADRTRRQDALALARQINAAEARVAELTHNYVPLAGLRGLPPTPAEFTVRLYTDGATYTFSIKDQRDVCHYGIFSDQDGLLYELTPQHAQIASAARK